MKYLYTVFILPLIASPVFAEDYTIDEVPYYVCEDGKCKAENHAILSNFSKAKIRERTAMRAATQEAVELQVSAEDREELERMRAAVIEEARLLVAKGEGSKKMDITLKMENVAFDYSRFRDHRYKGDKDAARSEINKRRDQLSRQQKPVLNKIKKLGGAVAYQSISDNLLDVIIPASSVEQLMKMPGILGVRESGTASTLSINTGSGRVNAMGLNLADALGTGGVNGSTRGSGTRIKFGVVDGSNNINKNHVSFKNSADGYNRIVDTDLCKLRGTRRRCINDAVGSADSHGTAVTSVLLSDLTDGQDPNFTSISDRAKRSGIAREAEAHYYSTSGSGKSKYKNIRVAIEEATFENDVDIINMSLGTGADDYDKMCSNSSFEGIREAIDEAKNQGVLLVTGAGNYAEHSGCNVSGFATLTHTLVAGGLNNVISTGGLTDATVADMSSRGHFNSTLAGGKKVKSRLVDLMVNNCAGYRATSGSNNYSNTGNNAYPCGTSLAAPQVAGAAGLLKETLYENGFEDWSKSAYTLRVLLSVMGDGYAAPGDGWGTSLSDTTGFGNLRFVDFFDTGGTMGRTSGLSVKQLLLFPGQSSEWSIGSTSAESSDVKGWKFAALIDYDYYGDSPDVTYQLIDKCPSGGKWNDSNDEVVLKTAASYPLKARIRMQNESDMSRSFHGRCLWVRATVNHTEFSLVPARIYTADYYYSGARSWHDMTD